MFRPLRIIFREAQYYENRELLNVVNIYEVYPSTYYGEKRSGAVG